jgi:hypothetical protein
MNWLLGITVLFVLLVAACGVWMSVASKTVEDSIDHAVKVTCYDSGFGDGANGSLKLPPFADKRCVEVYTEAYEDGASGNYDPPRE